MEDHYAQGITTVAGSSTPAASATITASKSLSNANKMTTAELNSLKSLTLKDTANSKTFAYTVTGWMKEPTQTTVGSDLRLGWLHGRTDRSNVVE